MKTLPRGCYILLHDGRTACYGRRRAAHGIEMHEISINDGGIEVVSEAEIKEFDENLPGWKPRIH